MPRLLAPLTLLATPALSAADESTVLVFLLAGQSKMEGHAKVAVMDDQADQPATRSLCAPFRHGRVWAERTPCWSSS